MFIINCPEDLEQLYRIYDSLLYTNLCTLSDYSKEDYQKANRRATASIKKYMRDANIIIDFGFLKKVYGIYYDENRGFIDEFGDDFIDEVEDLIYYNFPWTDRGNENEEE